MNNDIITINSELSGNIAKECIVLLKNNNILPLSKDVKQIALFGNGARRTVKGGTGSGDVNSKEIISVEAGLLNEGYKITTSGLLDELDSFLDEALEKYKNNIRSLSSQGVNVALLTMMGNPFTEPEFRKIEDKELDNYPADSAVYVLARSSGEGADRKAVPGDYYLSESEIHDIKLIASKYPRTVLVLNTGSVIDLSAVRDIVPSILLMGQTGSECGRAAAEIISGKASPSGKLACTWADKFEDYPYAEEFAKDEFDSYYSEGIYVGYRYFDTFNVKPCWSFGFGMSYTEFDVSEFSTFINGSRVHIDFTVRNIGNKYSGKEVIQIYVSQPFEDVDVPEKILAGFAKTALLSPGGSQRLSVEFPVSMMSVYSESESAWILSEGNYSILAGTSSDNVKAVAVINVSEKIVCEKCRKLFGDEHPKKLQSERSAITNKNIHDIIRLNASNMTTISHDYSQKKPELEKVKEMSLSDLATLCVGSARIKKENFSFIGNDSSSVPGAAGETTSLIDGIKNITFADGPAGIRINERVYKKDGLFRANPKEDPIFSLVLPEEMQKVDLSGFELEVRHCTALPVATSLAQSWNEELMELAGSIVASEMELYNIDVWLAPALNIQRNPLCGRNFEYYSEDPVLSGKCAAAVVKGVQKHNGKYACIKHLAANSQETNRNYNNSHISERTLREIYLRGFEICVKDSSPLTVMTSLNLINGVHAANSRDLLTDVLRNEWGFSGVVMTDWGTTSNFAALSEQKYPCSSSNGCITAGNDLIMPGSDHDIEDILNALDSGNLDKNDLQLCAENILKLINLIKDGVSDGKK